MRDEIVNKDGLTVMNRDIEIMTVEDLSKQFKEPEIEMAKWIKEIKLKYLEEAK